MFLYFLFEQICDFFFFITVEINKVNNFPKHHDSFLLINIILNKKNNIKIVKIVKLQVNINKLENIKLIF